MINKKGWMKSNAFHLALMIAFAIVLVFVFVGLSDLTSALPKVNTTGGNTITVTLNISNYSFSGRGNATLGYIINEDVNYLFNLSINYTSIDSGAQENLTDINVTLRGLTYLVTTAQSGIGQFGANFSITFAGAGEVGNGSAFNNWTRTNLTDANGNMVIIWNETSAALANTLVFMDRNATGQTVGLNYSKIWFNASAPTPGRYNITIRFFVNNSAGSMGNETNFTIIVNDTTVPGTVNFSLDGEIATTSYANVSGSIVVNISVVDNGNYSLTLGSSAREITYVNVTVWNASDGNTGGNGSSGSWFSASNLSAFAWNGNYWNVTIDTLKFPDGTYNISIRANDSQGNFNSTNISLITFDNTKPTASVVCSGPNGGSTVNTGDVVTCTCSPSDSLSGVNSTTTSITANPSTSSTGTFTESCSFADQSGNTASASDTYTVEQTPSGASTSSGTTSSAQTDSSPTTTDTTPTETASTKASHTFDSIMPGTPAVQTDVNADAGVKEISINVNGEAQNVELTVTKHDGKPAEVSVEKIGKLYTYLQIEATNLEGKLDKATIKIQVEKSWVADNELARDDVVLFKFDESLGLWNELATAFSEEDDTFYYYTAEVNSFSYFAIGEKVAVESAGKGKTWVWVILVLAVLGAVAWYVMNRKKK